MVMLVLGFAAWGVRILLAAKFQILSASDPHAINILSLFVSHAALIGQQFVYFAVRFTEEKSKKAKIAELNASLEKLWQEREQIIRERQADRDNLLRDMHDGFGSQLSTLRILAEYGRLSPAEFTQSLSDIQADLHLIVDTLNQPAPALKDCLADMRYRLSRRIPAEHVKLHWRVSLDSAPQLSSRETLHVLRVLQEAINNALRHAKASNIWITANHDEVSGVLTASVRDDGLGMNDCGSSGRGITNMQHRMREIGAALDVRELSPGTEIVITLRRAQPADRARIPALAAGAGA
jgi:signal transduction histidine kinase